MDLDTIGVHKGKSHNKMGIRATSTCDLILENVEIPSENLIGNVGEGFAIAMRQLNQARIGIASQALGIAQASLDTAIAYASQRVAFGKPILSMAQVKNRLAEMAVRIESARLLTWKAAHIYDSGDKSNKYSSFAKWQASECATYCAHNCIQILGGNGFLKDFSGMKKLILL